LTGSLPAQFKSVNSLRIFVKRFTDNTNPFLGVCHRRTPAACARRLATLFGEITEIFDDKAEKLKEKKRRIWEVKESEEREEIEKREEIEEREKIEKREEIKKSPEL
jgi:hypothetical protein